MKNNITKALDLIRSANHAVALTGAGISTLSGLADFRGEHNPIWDKYPQEKLFNLEYFREDPKLFYDFSREVLSRDYRPNIAHIALKKLEDKGVIKSVITQNIDGLHQAAGSRKVHELHGSIYDNRCMECGEPMPYKEFIRKVSLEPVPGCKCGGVIRPGIVFFGEPLPAEDLELSVFDASKADLMIVAGTSLLVQPAAYMPMYTLHNQGRIIMVNRGETYLDERADLLFPDIKAFFEAVAEGV